MIREMPAGHGFADIVLLPNNGIERPAMMLELKWDKSANTAIRQIYEKRYAGALKDFVDEIILMGISYDKKTKKHNCIMERMSERGTEKDAISDVATRIVDEKILRLLRVLGEEYLSAQEIMKGLRLRGEDNYRKRYLNPALDGGYIVRLYLDQPNRRDQMYHVVRKL